MQIVPYKEENPRRKQSPTGILAIISVDGNWGSSSSFSLPDCTVFLTNWIEKFKKSRELGVLMT